MMVISSTFASIYEHIHIIRGINTYTNELIILDIKSVIHHTKLQNSTYRKKKLAKINEKSGAILRNKQLT